MRFIDRKAAWRRLDRLDGNGDGGFGVVWGRRRIGKTRLLVDWCRSHDGLYTVADQSAPPIQRSYLSKAFASRFEGFDEVTYPSWRALLDAVHRQAMAIGYRGPFVFDEFPYLVAADPALPSIMQAWLDHEAKEAKLVVVIAGSAQHMMQGLTLDAAAPLFGRASQLLELPPLSPGFLGEALGLDDPGERLLAYTLLGGVPRYWELAAPYGHRLEGAIDELLLDPLGPLHNEPDHLLASELPSAVSLRPLLDAIGTGAHRLSEIAGRVGKPATSLGRSLTRLIELGYVTREHPFGASEKSSKRSRYLLSDPFMRVWFRVIAPHRAFLASAAPRARIAKWRSYAPGLLGEAFEELCRHSVPHLTIVDPHTGVPLVFGSAGRYWKAGSPEWDIVALSEDGGTLLLGEVKLALDGADIPFIQRATKDLVRKGVPPVRAWESLEICHAVFVSSVTEDARASTLPAFVFDARSVFDALGLSDG